MAYGFIDVDIVSRISVNKHTHTEVTHFHKDIIQEEDNTEDFAPFGVEVSCDMLPEQVRLRVSSTCLRRKWEDDDCYSVSFSVNDKEYVLETYITKSGVSGTRLYSHKQGEDIVNARNIETSIVHI